MTCSAPMGSHKKGFHDAKIILAFSAGSGLLNLAIFKHSFYRTVSDCSPWSLWLLARTYIRSQNTGLCDETGLHRARCGDDQRRSIGGIT
ncbi:Uncharacterised protein [Vibrio cholerae]|uniref:Uncharacterized protein n=1 Tax=Vibrio cholerae TaxID=666 RepID=A0A655WTK9_VIBCL|nr:Uncharacterised protein [Vibrio cholerae]